MDQHLYNVSRGAFQVEKTNRFEHTFCLIECILFARTLSMSCRELYQRQFFKIGSKGATYNGHHRRCRLNTLRTPHWDHYPRLDRNSCISRLSIGPNHKRVDMGRKMNSHAIAANSGIHLRILPAITLRLPLLIGLRF